MSDSTETINNSPPWNRPTKIVVAIAAILFIILVMWRFQTLVSPIIIAIILAYLLYPIIDFINERTGLKRSMVINIIYLLVAVLFIGLVVVVGVAVYSQALNLVAGVPTIIEQAPAFIESWRDTLAEPITIGTFTFTLPISTDEAINWQAIFNQVSSYINPALRQVGGSLTQVAFSTVGVIGWLIFILFVSVYISNDAPRFGELISDAADLPGYRKDAERIWREFGRIWNAYLRGQAILAVVIGVVVSVTLRILGVENSLALGLLSGLLEFIPFIGPFVGTSAAVIVALFQASNFWGLAPVSFAIVVLIAMTIIQQVENSVLVPRIVGDALDLNPLIVLVGAIMGSTVGGILGAILAAPVIATLKLVGQYAWRKFFDLSPFPEPELIVEDTPSWAERAWERWQLRRAGLRAPAKQENTPESDV